MSSFKDKGLSDNILKAITELGFESPTPIQEKTIPAILETADDLIALAQTGTGKTAAFGLPIIEQIDTNSKTVQALILCPTRELCIQIAKDLTNYTKYTKGLGVVPVYGGASIVPQMKDLKGKSHIIVGTPGRTLDLIKRKALKVNHIEWLVMDEADEMLTMGFKDDLEAILSTTNPDRQTLLFSATMPNGVRSISKNYMDNPTEITVGKRNTGAENVAHHYYVVKATNRYLALKRLADIHPNIYGIVFCRTRRETKEVADHLIKDGYNADALHGDLSQAQRDHVMDRFRNRNLQLLVATDVAARGIDVNELTHIINYILPDDPEVYIHRSGRTGRAGRSGTSISIVHSREMRRIKELEKITNKKFEYKKVPEGREICEKRLFNLIDKVENVEVDETQIESFLTDIYKKLEWMERDDLIKRFVSVEFNRFLEYYKNAKDLNISVSDSGRGRDRDRSSNDRRGRDRRGERGNRRDRDSGERGGRNSRRSDDFTRFYINVGSKHKVNASHLIGLINDTTNMRNIEIGKIDILRNFSFFEVDKSFEKKVKDSFNGASYLDVKLNVEPSSPKMENGNSGKSQYPNDKWKKNKKDNKRY